MEALITGEEEDWREWKGGRKTDEAKRVAF